MTSKVVHDFIKPVANAASIDGTWLTKILNKYFDTNCKILDFQFETLAGKEGFLSEIAYIFIKLEIDKNEKEEHFVIKFMPHTEEQRNFVMNGNLAKREVEFYKFAETELFKSVMCRSGLKLVIPDIIFCEREDSIMTIVMKNLKCLNYKTIILRDGSSLDHTLRAFSALAVIHAAGIFHFKKNNNYGVKKYIDFSFYDQFLRPNIEKLSEIFQGDELGNFFERLAPLSQCIRNYSLEHPLFETVVHGDFWSGQCMYSEDEKEVCILDWQFCNVGNPIVDLMGMFCMSTDPYVLENNLDQILKHYWEALSRNLDRSNIALPCSFEQFVNCVECHWITGFNYIAVSLHDFLGENNISDYRLKGLMKFLHKRNVFTKFLKENNIHC